MRRRYASRSELRIASGNAAGESSEAIRGRDLPSTAPIRSANAPIPSAVLLVHQRPSLDLLKHRLGLQQLPSMRPVAAIGYQSAPLNARTSSEDSVRGREPVGTVAILGKLKQ
jgi:hypothetical protein